MAAKYDQITSEELLEKINEEIDILESVYAD